MTPFPAPNSSGDMELVAGNSSVILVVVSYPLLSYVFLVHSCGLSISAFRLRRATASAAYAPSATGAGLGCSLSVLPWRVSSSDGTGTQVVRSAHCR